MRPNNVPGTKNKELKNGYQRDESMLENKETKKGEPS